MSGPAMALLSPPLSFAAAARALPPPPSDAKRRAAAAAVSEAIESVAAWRAGGGPGPLRAAADAVWRAGDAIGTFATDPRC